MKKTYFVSYVTNPKVDDVYNMFINTHITLEVKEDELIGTTAFRIKHELPQCMALINFWEEPEDCFNPFKKKNDLRPEPEYGGC